MSLKQNISTKYGTLESRKDSRSIHKVLFYCTASGREPVREWLKKIDPTSRKRIGEDLPAADLALAKERLATFRVGRKS